MKKISTLLLSGLAVLSLAACSQQTDNSAKTTTTKAAAATNLSTTTPATSPLQATSIPATAYGTYSEADLDTTYDANNSTKIVLAGTSGEITGAGAAIKDGTLTITAGGTYLLSGDFTGEVVVNAPDQNVKLVLDGVTITSNKNAAVYIAAAKNAYLTLAPDSSNHLTDASPYQFADANQEEPDATLFSKADLTINGTGSLEVTGNDHNGIRSKDDLVITGGNLTVTAKNNALKGKDSVSVLGGHLTLTTSEGDGIQANNTEDPSKGWIAIDGGQFTIQSGRDGIQAETDLKIATADLTIKTADGATSQQVTSTESYKGLKSGGQLIIDNGTFTIDSADDALHANGAITINNGNLTLASGDDGIHADTDLTINEGQVTVSDSYEGLEAAVITINGGTSQITASDDGLNAGGGSDTTDTTGQFGSDSFGGPGGGPGGGDQADESKEINITNGTVIVDAGGDGVDSNGNVNMSGGNLVVSGPEDNGNAALDYNGTWNQTGGNLLALGSSGMALTPSETSAQASLGVTLTSSSNASISVSVADQVLFTFMPTKNYDHLVVSSPSLKTGETVTVTSGATNQNSSNNGFTTGGSLTGGTLLGDYPLTGSVTNLSQDGRVTTSVMMMGGGPR